MKPSHNQLLKKAATPTDPSILTSKEERVYLRLLRKKNLQQPLTLEEKYELKTLEERIHPREVHSAPIVTDGRQVMEPFADFPDREYPIADRTIRKYLNRYSIGSSKTALDATLEAMTSPDAATDPRADESYPHPFNQKGTEPEQVKYAYGDPEFMNELGQEAFLDKTHEGEREAKEAFMADPFMQQLATEDGISMEDLWLQYKDDYTNEFHTASLDDLSAPPNPETATFFKESDPDELKKMEFTASLTNSGIRITAGVKSYGEGTPIGGTSSDLNKKDDNNDNVPESSATSDPTHNQQKELVEEVVNELTKRSGYGDPDLGKEPIRDPNGDTPTHSDETRTCADCEEEFYVDPRMPGSDYCLGCRNKMRTGAVNIKETPKMLPQRDDMRRHLDEDVKKDVMDGVMDGVDKVAWVDEDDEDDGPDGAYGTLYGKPLGGANSDVKDRLEYLRSQLRAEQISYGELSELQGLAEYIDPGDVELLEAAGVPENPDEDSDAYVELHCPVKKCTFTTGKWGDLEAAEGAMKRHYRSWHPEKQWPPKKQYRTTKEEKDWLKSMGIKARAKNAIKTEENIPQVCPNCSSQKTQEVDGSGSEDGTLVECLDCGCFFAL